MKLFTLLLPFFITITLTGCIENLNAETPLPESEFVLEESGFYIENGTFSAKQIKVIRDQQTYETELSRYTTKKPETLDFTKGQMLLLDMGQRNSGGYEIALTSIEVFDNYITAAITLTEPSNNCMVSMALTNPYQFVYVPTLKEILVTESLQIRDCAPK